MRLPLRCMECFDGVYVLPTRDPRCIKITWCFARLKAQFSGVEDNLLSVGLQLYFMIRFVNFSCFSTILLECWQNMVN